MLSPALRFRRYGMARARLGSVCFLVLTAIVCDFPADVLRAEDDDPIPPLDIGNDDSLPPVPPLSDDATPEEAKGGEKPSSDPSALCGIPRPKRRLTFRAARRGRATARRPTESPRRTVSRGRLSQAIFTQIGKMAVPGKKKEANDYFLYCIGELDVENRHADVRFDYKLGQRETADFLTDYVALVQRDEDSPLDVGEAREDRRRRQGSRLPRRGRSTMRPSPTANS